MYDYSLGKIKQVTDANSRVFQTIYDGLGRAVEEKQPDLTTPSTLVTKTRYDYTDTPNAVSIHKTDYLDNVNSADTYQYFDGLNRLIQERKEAESSGSFNARDIVYNNIGQVSKESLPYRSSGTSKTSATTDSNLLTTYSYDPMLRTTSIANAVGITSTVYDDWKTAITDANGKVKNYYKDAYGTIALVVGVVGVILLVVIILLLWHSRRKIQRKKRRI